MTTERMMIQVQRVLRVENLRLAIKKQAVASEVRSTPFSLSLEVEN